MKDAQYRFGIFEHRVCDDQTLERSKFAFVFIRQSQSVSTNGYMTIQLHKKCSVNLHENPRLTTGNNSEVDNKTLTI